MVDPSPAALAIPILVAAGIGALIGLERERSDTARIAGSRTFPLITVLGAVTQAFYPNLLAWAFGMVFVLVAIASGARMARKGPIGLTTAVTALLAFVYGALTTRSAEGLVIATALGVLTTALLAYKEPLHRFASQITPGTERATLKFLIVALVVLPILPNQPIAALWELNPRVVWFMVVLVSGIDLASYMLVRRLGPRNGLWATGIVGGLVSSTATAVAMAQQTRRSPETTRVCASALAAASLIVAPRVAIELAIVHPAIIRSVGIPLAVMVATGATILAWQAWGARRSVDPDGRTARNPLRLLPALGFGAAFALILVVTGALHDAFGSAGVYASSIIAGFADVDAITLSLASLSADANISNTAASRGILLAIAANTIIKIIIAAALGSGKLALGAAAVLLPALLAGFVAASI